MLEIQQFDSLQKLYDFVEKLDDKSTYFLGEFLREVDTKTDEFFVVLEQGEKTVLLKTFHPNDTPLKSLIHKFYVSYLFENELYDFYGKTTDGIENNTLRLHLFDKNFFPKRKLGKPMVKERKDFIFTKVDGHGLVEVPVGPIHAGIIPPAHFRFTCDGEDTVNLDIKMGWKYKGVENYFTQEKDLGKLLTASQEIVGDSSAAYARGFVRNIEKAAKIVPDENTILNRLILVELERIYNHLWTVGALGNDVGQAFILNGCLSIRENMMDLNEKLFGSRILRGIIDIGYNKRNIDKENLNEIHKVLDAVSKRFTNILYIEKFNIGMYDRFENTGKVSKQTAQMHSALGVVAKASGLEKDMRVYDEYYKQFKIDVKIHLGIQGDVYDRLTIRINEIFQSINIIKQLLKHVKDSAENKVIELPKKLQDGYYISRVEGHRGEILQFIYIEKGQIRYYKCKDPSFVNWTLLEYSVLNNIIADFPICNKSFDLSYSGFDM